MNKIIKWLKSLHFCHGEIIEYGESNCVCECNTCGKYFFLNP